MTGRSLYDSIRIKDRTAGQKFPPGLVYCNSYFFSIGFRLYSTSATLSFTICVSISSALAIPAPSSSDIISS